MTERNVSGLKKYNRELNMIAIESIEEAVLKLMKNKKYSSITISEICKAAGVSRMAFYNNFNTKDDILFSIVKKENKILIETIGSPFKQEVTLDWYINLFKSIEKNKTSLKLMFDANFKYRYLQMINQLVLQDIDNISLEDKNKRLLWAGAIVNRIICWIDDGLTESANDLAIFCFKRLHSIN